MTYSRELEGTDVSREDSLQPTNRLLDSPDPTTYLFISDGHFERRKKRPEKSAREIEEYGKKYDADILLIGGDMGGAFDIRPFLEKDFERTMIVKGNHDTWWLGDFGGDKYLSDLDMEAGKDYDDKEIEWQDKIYKMCLKHSPSDFNLSHSTTAEEDDGEQNFEYDIILYGHSHAQHTRCMADGTLADCPGSLELNNKGARAGYRTPEGELPRRSAHIIQTFFEGVTVQHLDTDDGEIKNTSHYLREDGILKPAFETLHYTEREDRRKVRA